MKAFRLTRKARDDLKAIARYTETIWGREQRNRYLALLDRRFALLAVNPALGQACDEIRPGYLKFHADRHTIFYRQASQGIEIVRILHGSMDLDRYL